MPTLKPLFPLTLIIIMFSLTALYTCYSYMRVNKEAQKKTLLTVRLAALFCLLIVTLRPRMEYSKETTQKDRIYFLTDQSNSMTIKDMPGGYDRQQFLKQLFKRNVESLNALKEVYDLKSFSFAKDIIKNDQDDVSTKATAMGTGLLKTARTAKIRKVKGLVLFSDGLTNSGTSINKAISELNKRKIPVYAMALGQDEYRGNIVDGVLQEINCPQSIKRKSELKVSTHFLLRGLKNNTATLEIRVDDKIVSSKRIDVAKQEESFVKINTIETKDLDQGYHKLTATLITGNKEISPVNNTMDTYFQILEGGLKILLVATSPSPDFKFLNRLLSSYDDFESTIKNPFYYRTQAGKLFLRDLPVESYDLIILQNPDFNIIPLEFLQKCQAIMKNRRQGLIFYGPTIFSSLRKIKMLEDYIPSLSEKEKNPSEPTPMLLSRLGSQHFVSSFLNPKSTALEAKPLPTIEGVSSNPELALPAKTLLSIGETPLLVTSANKRCRTAWFNTNAFWQLMTAKENRKTYKEIWRRLIYYLTSRESELSARLAIFSGKSRYLAGDKIIIGADLLDAKSAPVVNAEITLNYYLDESKNKPQQFSYSNSEYQAELSVSKEGLYTVYAETSLDGKTVKSNEVKLFVQEPRLEFNKILSDYKLMDKIAQMTEGRSVLHNEFSALLKELIASSQVRKVRKITGHKDGWDNYLTYIILALLLCIEWQLRRRTGLP